MAYFYFLFIINISLINFQIIENPIFLVEDINPFVLSTNDEYYYVITKGNCLKINKESGRKDDIKENIYNQSNYYFYFEDNSYNNYLFYSDKYYQIIYNPFISYKEITVNSKAQGSTSSKMINVGSIAKDNDFVFYGYDENNAKILLFSSKNQYYRAHFNRNNENNNLSCKFVENQIYICAININADLFIYCFKYHIDKSSSQDDSLKPYRNAGSNSLIYSSISGFGLYDITSNNDIKLLCRENDYIIKCRYLKITIHNEQGGSYMYDFLGNEFLSISTSKDPRKKLLLFLFFYKRFILLRFR